MNAHPATDLSPAIDRPGLLPLTLLYVLLTAYRDFRDNFAVEIWAAPRHCLDIKLVINNLIIMPRKH